MKRGEIYIVNFGKKYNSEFGKKRPALIIQNNIANRNIDKVEFKGVSVIPLSTNITTGNLRVFINGRDNLLKPSVICINEICTLDLSRIEFNILLTSLSQEELTEVERKLMSHLGVEN